jgi:hypothetical protein
MAGIACVSYFALRLILLAVTINPAVPPDEASHYGRIYFYSKTIGIPHNGPETYSFSLLTNIPYLYYYAMGKIVLLNIGGMPNLLFLRLVNAVLSLMTVWVGFAWARMVMGGRIAPLLLLVIMTNTPMFTFLSASVNYDNLANLFAAAAIYSFSQYLKTPRFASLNWCIVWLSAGCLTKEAMIPLAVIIAGLFAMRIFSRCIRSHAGVRPLRPQTNTFGLAPIFLTILLVTLNVRLYCGNMMSYGKLVPDFDRVVGVENAKKERIFARGWCYSNYANGVLSYEGALKAADSIQHPGDRLDAIAMIRQVRHARESGFKPMGRLAYAAAWSDIMLGRIYGIAAHRTMEKRGVDLAAFAIVWIMAIVVFVLRFRPGAGSAPLMYSYLVAVAYVFIIMQIVNYPGYASFGIIGLATQGRYVFPVLVPLCGFLAGTLASGSRPIVNFISFSALSTVFIIMDFPYFLSHVDWTWFY